MTLIPEIDCAKPVKLADHPSLPEASHLFDELSAGAIRAALAAMRPLLVRGEPGVGKTQLAAAAASVLKRPLVARVVDARTESRDLMWDFDAVLRLADAQIAAALAPGKRDAGDGSRTPLRERLAVANYVRPGPLWWAFDWESALRQAERTSTPIPVLSSGADPANGCVVLLDEIDKADTDVPNGLLEALGAGCFTPLGQSDPIRVVGEPPLVVITTNEERVLPSAFLRRCLVHEIKLPGDEAALVEYLVARARVHFPAQAAASEAIFRKAAEILARDRAAAIRAKATPRPGQAEYLDLLRAVFRLAPNDPDEQQRRLEGVARYVVRKHEQGGP